MQDFRKQRVVIAIAISENEWQYLTFNTWEEAREAVNAARAEGKAAVFYDGATFLEPPQNFVLPNDTYSSYTEKR